MKSNAIRILKPAAVFALLAAAGSLLQGAENLMKAPETTYTVQPGQWNRNIMKSDLGKLIDPDLDQEKGTRKGMLTDGTKFQQAVIYNYHNTPSAQRFITIEIDLGKPRTVTGVMVCTVENNSMYKPAKIEVSGSADKMVFQPLGESGEWAKEHFIRTAQLKGEWPDCRFLQIRIRLAGSWINVTEIGVFGN